MKILVACEYGINQLESLIERNERLGIVPNKSQLEFAQRYIYSGKFRKETWSEYCKRLKIRK